MALLEHYHQQLIANNLSSDPQQLIALTIFQKIYDALLHEHKARHHLITWIRRPKTVTGLYLWGSVGIGKTFLMDCFFKQLPFSEKKRMHFHHFMQFIHLQLKELQGKKNPLQHIAKTLAKNTLVLCFDEVVVNDIVDAMLLGHLFQALFSEGICLIATSNVMPDNLYQNGLQRQLFLQAINKLKQHVHIHHLISTVDYRFQLLKHAGVFHTPDNDSTQEIMENSFHSLINGSEIKTDPITLHDRPINIYKQAKDVIWFHFQDICHPPRSQQDYLAIASQYKTVFISHIPIIAPRENNKISLFIRLIDVLYDARVRLVLSSAVTIEHIYTTGEKIVDYTRTRSRLMEMQSEHYFLQ